MASNKVLPFHVVFVIACVSGILHIAVLVLPSLVVFKTNSVEIDRTGFDNRNRFWNHERHTNVTVTNSVRSSVDLSGQSSKQRSSVADNGEDKEETFEIDRGDGPMEDIRLFEDQSSSSSENIGDSNAIYSSEDDSSIGDSSEEEFYLKRQRAMETERGETLLSIGLWYGYICLERKDGVRTCQYVLGSKFLEVMDSSTTFTNGNFSSTWTSVRREVAIGFLLCLIGLFSLCLKIWRFRKRKELNSVYIAIVAMVISAIVTLVGMGRIILQSWENMEEDRTGSVFYMGWGVGISISSAVLALSVTLSSAMILWNDVINRRIRKRFRASSVARTIHGY